MPVKVSEDDFIACFKRLGSPAAVAKALGIDVRGVYNRRNAIEARRGIRLESLAEGFGGRPKVDVTKRGYRAIKENVSGTVIIGSDLHAWPGERSVAFGAFVHLIRELKPSMVILNGDAVDGARISRHPAMAWATLPTVADELDAVRERMSEIESAAPDGCPLVWPQGNHDMRYSAKLAQNVPEFAGIHGMDLGDHFPAWNLCMSIWINDHTVVKHRHAGGIHGAYNNTLKGGKNIVTGHTHRLLATPFGDYNGLRWGVECGTLADFGPETDRYLYAEDGPVNWSTGFVVLTFLDNGMMIEPECCRVLNNVAYFRGSVINHV